MSINAINSSIPKIEKIIPKSTTESNSTEGVEFGKMFKNALNEVDSIQKDADEKITNITLGNGKTSSHEAMIALEKADMAFQLMTNVRAKIIRAYEEVLRTQV